MQIESVLRNIPKDKLIRFDAIKHQKGYIGCTKSHIAVLEMAIANQWKNYIVFEDDCIWTQGAPRGYANLQALTQSPYDVITLGIHASAKYNKKTLKLVEGKNTTAYLVNGHYYTTLLNNFKEGLEPFEKGKESRPIDIHWLKLQKVDNWFCAKPDLVIQREGYSDIQKTSTAYMYNIKKFL